MFEGYITYNGVEIAHNTRVTAYRTGGAVGSSSCGCPDLAFTLGHDPYVAPSVDPAPWYRPEEPESAGFGGFWVSTLEGYLDAPYDISPTQRIGDGAETPKLRANNRELTVTGWIYASNRCSAEWGLRWLTAQLAGCSSCSGSEMCLFRCCPPGPDEVEENLRTLKNVRLISGPTVEAVAPAPEEFSCVDSTRPIIQIEFVLSADPAIWRQPIVVADEMMWPEPTGEEDCNIVFDSSDICNPDNPNCLPGSNSPVLGCAPNSTCPQPPNPPRAPSANVGCVCIPLYVVTQCADITSSDIPNQLSSALRFELYSGDMEIRNLAIRIIPNPRGLPPEDLDECGTCGTYYIEYVPAESVLTIDGTTQTTRMSCPGGAVSRADHVLYGSGGGPLQHTLLRCREKYTLCADMDVETFSPLATLTVERITREM